jgi:two-component system sensor histidine kinase AlgZ
MSEATPRRWLPEFCSLPTLFAVMIVAELVALVVVLAPDPSQRPWLPRLGVASVYVQWLALLNAVALCSMRQPLERLSPRAGFIVAWLVSITVTVLGSAVVWQMDQALGLGLTAGPGEGLRFLLGNAVVAALISAALLNTIVSLIRTRPAEAERTVEDLADLFRAALGSSETPGTLGEELDLMDHYLRIEKLRLGDRLRVEIEADDLPRDLPLPRLLLQPLVENAIYHGVQPLANGGTIRISGRHPPGRVEITIRNPLPPDAAPKRNGHALANIRARIEYHFGSRGQLSVEPGGGEYAVTVRLPDASPDR